ncbi:MAG TPA: response regulator [Methanobacterium sp.]|nr:response regulator [Methanobacterium sp.]
MEYSRFIDVLVVEDNPADARLIMEAFDCFNEKCDIKLVEDGVEASDYLYKRGKYNNCKTPQLILLDLNLPKKNGRDLLIEIKNDDKLRLIPIIILTTSNDNNDVCVAYWNYANAYIAKPSDFDEFEELIKIFEAFWFRMAILPKCGMD